MSKELSNSPLVSSDLCLLVNDVFLDHAISESHPENPGRLIPLHQAIQKSPYLALTMQNLVSATDAQCLRVHSSDLVASLHECSGKIGWVDPDTYYSEKSIETALLAAGSVAKLASDIWKGKWRRGFALVRPPGHHATPTRAMGFCLVNHVAIAVAEVRAHAPHARVAVVDFDLHHGNGTQDFFYKYPNVLFISSHRFPYYPGTGSLREVGESEGKGTTVNFPLDFRFGNDFFVSLYEDTVRKILREYRPEMIFVSAGFDGHEQDPMQGFRMQTSTYGRLAKSLIEAAEGTTGKILFCLEGGYNPEALRESGLQVIDSMVNTLRKPQEVLPPASSVEGANILESFAKYYRPFFPAL